MATYNDRDKVLEKSQLAYKIALLDEDQEECDVDFSDEFAVSVADIVEILPVDVVPVADLKEFAEDVLYQFGYKINYKGRLHLSSGGLSTLEWAFSILGWDDPKPFPEGECEWKGCHEYATGGTPTPDGYKRVCSKHFAVIKAREEAERTPRMDGDS